MTTIQTSKPSLSIDLCPDLAALVETAWKNVLQESSERPITTFLQEKNAVASSVVIGQGTSFLVTRRFVPEIRQFWAPAKAWHGITVQPEHKEELRSSRHVVYKISQIHFDEQGDPPPSKRAQYASILLDFMVLSHRPVLEHENIVSMLGLAWGDSGFPNTCEIPIPIVEHADFGNLGDYQTRKILSVRQKTDIFRDIAAALKFLHECSITHGDVKSENILLFSQPDNGIRAKISDFGFSVLGSHGYFNFLPRSTLLWAAPETKNGSMTTEEAPQSDIFSFGLLVWRVMLDGADPLCPYYLTSTGDDILKAGSKDLKRLPDKLLIPELEKDLFGGSALCSAWMPKRASLENSSLIENDSPYRSRLATSVPLEHIDSEIQALCNTIFKQTLLRQPSRRQLRPIFELLSEKSGRHKLPRLAAKSIIHQPAYSVLQSNNYTISWNFLRDLPASVCNHIMKQKLRKLEVELAAGHPNLANFAYGLTCCYISGMGSDRHLNEKKSKELLLIAARNGSTGSHSILPRFARNFGFNLDGINELVTKCAMWGSLAALEDLPRIDAAGYEKAISFLRTNMCGIGAQLFRYWNPPWTMDRLKSTSFVDEYISKSPEPAAEVEVNPRGDGILHAAASLAQDDLVTHLVEHYGFDVNQLNGQGESPLLCAMRSGNIRIVEWLLDHGAKLFTISTFTQETSLHWLISMEQRQVYGLAKRLFDHGGAKECLQVWASACKYASTLVSGYKDKWDNLCDGTPLHWAICRKRIDLVRIFISYGADPSSYGESASNMTPMELAAFLHEPTILKFLIESKFPGPRLLYFDLGERKTMIRKAENEQPQGPEEQGKGTIPCGLSEWIKYAIQGCDNWRMLFRHGEKWTKKMEDTFRILGKELNFAFLNVGVDGRQSSPVKFAARKGFHDAVDMALKYMGGVETINDQQELERWSPIFWAVYRDHKRIFYKLLEDGADIRLRMNSPNRRDWMNWTLLHQAARFVVDGDLEICTKLLDEGLPPDGVKDPAYGGPPQTPLSIAIENNQFELADLLRDNGANMNATCGYIDYQRIALTHQVSILGCNIISNFRYSAPRFKYLLWPRQTPDRTHVQPEFVVAPQIGWTALHVAVAAEVLLQDRIERDADVATEILSLLLEKFESSEELNSQTSEGRMTALHLALKYGKVDAAKQLLEMDELDLSIRNEHGRTAKQLAEDMLGYFDDHDDDSLIKQDLASRSKVDQIWRMIDEREE